VEKRQADLELALAKASGVPTLYLDLVGKAPILLWDFQHSDELIAEGYEIASRTLDEITEW
jgi:hypothetical protein